MSDAWDAPPKRPPPGRPDGIRSATVARLCAVLALAAAAGCGRGDAPQRGAGENVRAPALDPAEVVARLDDGVAPIDPDAPLKFRDFNLVLVSFDALQARHVGILGAERDTTPALDALARRGFVFANACSVSSWTVPASMTWFTGVYPSEHGLTNKYAVYAPPVRRSAALREVSPQLVTLAEVLRQNGYATGGFTGNAGVNGNFGFELGFDVYFCEPGRFGGLDRSIDRALEWLAERRGGKFFLFLHGYDAHGQHAPEEGYDYRYVDPAYDGRFTGSVQEQEVLREEGLVRGETELRDADVRFWRAVYDEKVRRADERFLGFLDAFRRLGLAGRTLFVLTSDHGTELWEHRRFDHGFTLYDELLHVPLVVRLPGRAGGRIVPDRVGSIDVMPTILDLLDVDVPETVRRQMRGRSLVPALRGEPVARDVFSETDYRLYTFKRSVLAPDGWKLIFTLESRTRELYDLDRDPGETRNLAHAEPDRADALQRRLFEHFRSLGHDLDARPWETGLNPVYPSQARDAPPLGTDPPRK